MRNHWSLESWGSSYAPENADEIIDRANELIDAYAETHDEDETAAYSERLWDRFCMTGRVEDGRTPVFTVIPGASGSIRELGVRWASDSICINRDVERQIGENRMQDITDDLCSYDGPLYQGSDGILYIVEWYYGNDEPVPACWMPVEQINV